MSDGGTGAGPSGPGNASAASGTNSAGIGGAKSGGGQGGRAQPFDSLNLPFIPAGFFMDISPADGTFTFQPISNLPPGRADVIASTSPQFINQDTDEDTSTNNTVGTDPNSIFGGQSNFILDRFVDLITNPSLPEGTELQGTFINPQPGEFLQGSFLGGGFGASAGQASAGQATATATGFDGSGSSISAQGLGAQTAASIAPKDAFTFDATQLTPEQINDALVSTELERILDFEDGNIPAFARGAFRTATAVMNARGLGASSIAAEAITAGIINSALPVAQGNSAVRLQAMLSNQNADNVAKQINAQSKNQVQQFYDSLAAQINTFNAAEVNRVGIANQQADLTAQVESARNTLTAAITDAQLGTQVSIQNVQLSTQTALQNAALSTQISQFNASLQDSRDKFNVQNQLIIEQSNVAWRRSINTANTAIENSVNQTNAANLLGLSNFALASVWQQWRDEAYWAFISSENMTDREHNLTIAAFNRDSNLDLLDVQQDNNLFSGLGGFVSQIIGPAVAQQFTNT